MHATLRTKAKRSSQLMAPPLRLLSPPGAAMQALPRVDFVERQGSLLHRNPRGDDDQVLSLNLTGACGNGHALSFGRVFPRSPDAGVVQLYQDTAERLEQALGNLKAKPRAVCVSPGADPFPPLNEVQRESARVAEVLGRHGVEAWFMTRGYIRPAIMAALAAQREFVRITVGLTTLDRTLQRTLEPLTAPPRLRLRQLAQCAKLEIRVQVALEPLVPGVTDTRDNLVELLEALTTAGVRNVSAGYLFLRQGTRRQLQPALASIDREHVLDAYAQGPVLHLGPAAPGRYLPKRIRQRGYASLMALAAKMGISVSISKLTNPDFGAAAPVETKSCPRQLRLPMF